jgi:uncharacterized protein with FMN-binding domain
MRRIVVWVVGTMAGLVLLFSYHTSTEGQVVTTAATGAAAAGVVTGGGSTPGSSSTSTAAPAPTAAPPRGPDPTTPPTSAPHTTAPPATAPPTTVPRNLVVNGQAYQTRWGIVQVQVTISGGRVADVTPISLTAGNRHDQAVNAVAVPILRQQAIATNSANLDTISGATITSTGYIMSLQSALDAANLHK